MFAFGLIGLFFAAIALMLGILALCSKIVSYLDGAIVSVALFFLTLTAALMTYDALFCKAARQSSMLTILQIVPPTCLAEMPSSQMTATQLSANIASASCGLPSLASSLPRSSSAEVELPAEAAAEEGRAEASSDLAGRRARGEIGVASSIGAASRVSLHSPFLFVLPFTNTSSR